MHFLPCNHDNYYYLRGINDMCYVPMTYDLNDHEDYFWKFVKFVDYLFDLDLDALLFSMDVEKS